MEEWKKWYIMVNVLEYEGSGGVNGLEGEGMKCHAIKL